MQVHFGEELLRAEWKDSIACLGTFDGVHLGHQEVISTAVGKARASGLPCVLITFDRHPASVLAPDKCPKPIASLTQNLRQFERLGVSVALILPFTKELSETSATAFLENVILGETHARHLVVGHDFAFGKGREGTTTWLSERIDTFVVPPFEVDGNRVSSSAIRRGVAAGEVAKVESWLGRHFAVEGVVVSGAKLGRQLGFPTINLGRSYDSVLPLDGIYAGVARTSLGAFKAAISVGFRPTVDGDHRTVEAYLIGFPNREIYGFTVELEFHQRIREEVKFDSLDALKTQMVNDVELVAKEIALP